MNRLNTSDAAESQERNVDEGLENAGTDCNCVIEVFGVVAVDPIGNIESSVESHQCKVVGCEDLNFSGLPDHPHLRQHHNRFQVDGVGPGDLHEAELVIDAEGKSQTRNQQNLNPVEE